MRQKKRHREIFGKLLKNQDCGNLILSESLYPLKARMPRHTHEIAHISLVLRGSFTEISRHRERFTESSTLIIHPPDEDHAVSFHNVETRIFSFHIKPQLHERIRDFTNILDTPAVFKGDRPTWLASQLYRESRMLDEVSTLMLEGLALEVVATVSRRFESLREQTTPPRWLRWAQEYLHGHFAENISLTELAGAVDVHPVHLAREFRRRHGCSMGEYIRRLRVQAACNKISDSDLPFAEIALSVGFYDQSHFSNIFKRLTGTTPTQYRATFRRP